MSYQPNGWWVRENNGGLIIPMIAEGSFRCHQVGDWRDELALIEVGARAAWRA